MIYYLRLYRNAIIATAITILVMIAVPSVITPLVNDLPPSLGSVLLRYHSSVVLGGEGLALIIGAVVVWMLVRDQEDTVIELGMDETAVDIYRNIRDRGIEPAVAQQVVNANTSMDEDMRGRDWQQANQPSFATELGYRLGIDGETRKMMREFFANSGAEVDTRRSFSTSLKVTIENGNIKKSHTTDAVIEPVSRFRPIDPEHDPNWTGDIAPEIVKAKIFGDWNDDPVPDDPDTGDDSHEGHDTHVEEVEEEVHQDAMVIEPWPEELVLPEPEPEPVPLTSDTLDVIDGDGEVIEQDDITDAETEALFAAVSGDPVIAGLIEAMKLTRRLDAPDNITYVYAYYGSDQALLVTELREPLVTHVDRIKPTVVPLAVQAGVRRCRTASWIVDITSSASREADLSAIVWVPIGIARLGDAGNHTAWKLMPVASGSRRTFHVEPSHAALTAVRLELLLGNVYEDCQVGQSESSMFFTVPSLGVTIELVVDATLNHSDEDIHRDDDYVEGPASLVVHDVPLLADMARAWLAERLDESDLDLNDWLPLVNMITTLLMRIEPVTSKELLGPWATPDSGRGKDLILKLQRIFGDAFSGGPDGWVLANVRCDVFWLQEVLSRDDDPAEIVRSTTDFVVRKFRPGYSQSLLSLSSLDPRMRSTDGIRLEQIIRDVLNDTLDLLSPNAEGVLRQNLGAIAAMLGREL
jgi:hypothetical protein